MGFTISLNFEENTSKRGTKSVNFAKTIETKARTGEIYEINAVESKSTVSEAFKHTVAMRLGDL